jgi:DNA (cytosine-5)-methyltransferase 1
MASSSSAGHSLRVLELYCGIGGAAAALGGLTCGAAVPSVVAAVDINRRALDVYRRNFAHPTLPRAIDRLPARELAGLGADLWWLSPPCQPFTRRGLRRDDEDRRSRSLLALVDRLGDLGADAPAHLALENVPGFQGSRTHARLIEALERIGYGYREGTLCPSELGVPNRRLRYYLAASRTGPVGDFRPAAPKPWTGTLRGFLGEAIDRVFDPLLRVDPELAARYPHALDVVHPDEPGRVTACFTAAYGRSPVRSGSYLALPDGGIRRDRSDSGIRRDRSDSGIRRFGPREILALLGFPETYALPADLPTHKAWPLAGNSLSVPAVRRVLAALPPFGRRGEDESVRVRRTDREATRRSR